MPSLILELVTGLEPVTLVHSASRNIGGAKLRISVAYATH